MSMGADVVVAHLRAVRIQVAATEQAAVDLRVQRLDAAVENLRRAGEIAHRDDRDARLRERPGGAARRQDLHTQLVQAAREVDQSGLVTDTHQGSLDQSHLVFLPFTISTRAPGAAPVCRGG